METMQNNPRGAIYISERAVEAIAAVTASRAEGVAALSSNLADGVASMLGRGGLSKGVDVVQTDGQVEIQIRLTAQYGCRIPDVALQVQETVKSAVETMTGYKVSAVHIVVQAIDFRTAASSQRR